MNTLPLEFPQPLSEKYRPHSFDAFIGLEKQRKILTAFSQRPMPCAWLFVGASGTGKSTMALALSEQLHSEHHVITSQNCNVQAIEDVCRMCSYVPMFGKQWHVIQIEEADSMSQAAQLKLLSKLDSVEPVPSTIFVFTANDVARLEQRFLSRCRVLEFSSYGLRSPLAKYLAEVWEKETGSVCTLNTERIAKDCENNVRAALMALELELLAQ